MLVNTPGTIPSLTVAGRVFTDLSNLIVLYSAFAGVGAGYSTPRLSSASSGYRVPVGKSFRVLAVQVQTNNAVANSGVTLGYQDTDTGACSNTAPTNGVVIGGTNLYAYMGVGEVGVIEYPCDFSIPAGKYLATYNGNTASAGFLKIFGYVV